MKDLKLPPLSDIHLLEQRSKSEKVSNSSGHKSISMGGILM